MTWSSAAHSRAPAVAALSVVKRSVSADIQVVRTVADLRRALKGRPRPTLVPTMGSLHAGHLSLVELARRRGGPVVTSIYADRLQFSPHEHFDHYPRCLEGDFDLLEKTGCDIAFAPSEREVFPESQFYTVQPPPALANVLEGVARPGALSGVCTVMFKLCSIVQPEAIVLGKKDYQQLRVVSQMLKQFDLPIEVVAGDIVRDSDGLALSSRNSYLEGHLRPHARQLSAVLRNLIAVARTGKTDWRRLERRALSTLTLRGWQPDYIAVRRQADLGEPSTWPSSEPLVVLGAARIGSTRLIDNIEF